MLRVNTRVETQGDRTGGEERLNMVAKVVADDMRSKPFSGFSAVADDMQSKQYSGFSAKFEAALRRLQPGDITALQAALSAELPCLRELGYL